MTDAAGALLALFVGLSLVVFGLLVARALRAVVAAVRDLVAELGYNVSLIRQSQERIERRLGLWLEHHPVDDTERHRRPPAEPPEY